MADEAPEAVLTFWRDFAAALDRAEPPVETFGVALFAHSTRALEDSWEHGKIAAKIRWGTDGSMKRCIRLARKYMTDPGGYCATRHKHATGEWPTTHGDKGIPS